MRSLRLLGALPAATAALAGCGSGGTVTIPTVHRADRRPGERMIGNRLWLRLFAACVALACGAAGVVVAILLVRGALA